MTTTTKETSTTSSTGYNVIESSGSCFQHQPLGLTKYLKANQLSALPKPAWIPYWHGKDKHNDIGTVMGLWAQSKTNWLLVIESAKCLLRSSVANILVEWEHHDQSSRSGQWAFPYRSWNCVTTTRHRPNQILPKEDIICSWVRLIEFIRKLQMLPLCSCFVILTNGSSWSDNFWSSLMLKQLNQCGLPYWKEERNLKEWFCEVVNHARQFVAQRLTYMYLEIDMDDLFSSQLVSQAFRILQSCWGVHHVSKKIHGKVTARTWNRWQCIICVHGHDNRHWVVVLFTWSGGWMHNKWLSCDCWASASRINTHNGIIAHQNYLW